MSILEKLISELEGIYEVRSDDNLPCETVKGALDFIRTSPQAAEEIAEAFTNMLDNAQRGNNADLINDAVDRHWHNLNDYDPEDEFSDFDDARDNTTIIDWVMIDGRPGK